MVDGNLSMYIRNEEEFNRMFVNPSEEASDWEDAVFQAGINGDDKEVERLFMQTNEIYLDESQINTAIETFTRKESPEEKDRLLNGLKEIDWIKDVRVENNVLHIGTEKGPINVGLLSDMDGYRDDLRLLTSGRKGFCHSDSIKMCRQYNDAQIVTGYIYGLSDKAKYLHSWVEFEQDGKCVVADYTMNVVMNKEGYYLIKHAEELSRVSHKQIIDDLKILGQLSKQGIVFRENEYLVFRDEIMKDLEKNFGDNNKDSDREDR
jgi:hypothetical protein